MADITFDVAGGAKKKLVDQGDGTHAERVVVVNPAALAANSIVLLTARTANGSDGGVDWPGGEGLLSVYGTWGAATVQIAYSPDGGTTYIDTDGALFIANATLLLAYPAGKVRATIASASGPTSLSAKLQRSR